MQIRRQSGVPTAPPHVGSDEVLLDDVTGQMYYRDADGEMMTLSPKYRSYVARITDDETCDDWHICNNAASVNGGGVMVDLVEGLGSPTGNGVVIPNFISST